MDHIFLLGPSKKVEREHPLGQTNQTMAIDFGRLRTVNSRTGTIRRFRMLDESGKVVRDWDNEVGRVQTLLAIQEKKKELRKCCSLLELCVYWWTRQV